MFKTCSLQVFLQLSKNSAVNYSRELIVFVQKLLTTFALVKNEIIQLEAYSIFMIFSFDLLDHKFENKM